MPNGSGGQPQPVPTSLQRGQVDSTHGTAALPLQLREAPQGIEVWTRSQDTGHAGWVDQQVADIESDLLIENVFAVAEERHLHAFCLGPTGDLHSSRIRWPSNN